MTMRAVGRAAGGMVEEVRRQFREFPGILLGTQRPDYARCVEISTAAAQKEMIAPSMLALVVPVVVGVLFGVAGVLGLLGGTLTAGFALAIMMANAGGAWDNAKKYVEDGNYNGKGSENHKASVVGDTVGDPLKDTAGPALNPMIKVMNLVALILAPIVVQYTGLTPTIMVIVAICIILIVWSVRRSDRQESAADEPGLQTAVSTISQD